MMMAVDFMTNVGHEALSGDGMQVCCSHVFWFRGTMIPLQKIQMSFEPILEHL